VKTEQIKKSAEEGGQTFFRDEFAVNCEAA
jgi:hypothetical protein